MHWYVYFFSKSPVGGLGQSITDFIHGHTWVEDIKDICDQDARQLHWVFQQHRYRQEVIIFRAVPFDVLAQLIDRGISQRRNNRDMWTPFVRAQKPRPKSFIMNAGVKLTGSNQPQPRFNSVQQRILRHELTFLRM